LKKLSHNSCVVLPVTTQKHVGDWFIYKCEQARPLGVDEPNPSYLYEQASRSSVGASCRRIFGIKKVRSRIARTFQYSPRTEARSSGESQKAYPNEYFEGIAISQTDANNLGLRIREESGRMGVMATPSTTPNFANTSVDFDGAYARLNDEQKAAVDAIKRACVRRGGAGYGKDPRYSHPHCEHPEAHGYGSRGHPSADLHRDRIEGNAGASSSDNRLHHSLENPHHTFHGFAQSLVTRFPDQFPRIIGSEIATDAERAEILETAILESGANVKLLRPFGDPLWYHYEMGRPFPR